jgi:formylglycine-generating enzyme required for sulfatase activity
MRRLADMNKSEAPIRVALVTGETFGSVVAQSSQRASCRVQKFIAGALAATALTAWFVVHAGAAEALRPGQAFRDCNDGCPEMVVVPAGSYMMGSDHEFSRGPRHPVTIKQPLAVGKFEVSFAEWQACVAGGGCKSNQDKIAVWKLESWVRSENPAVMVTWPDAKDYVAWLSKKTAKTYRLLTEAEWEYVARAGTTTAYSWGDEIGQGNANCVGCGSQWDDKIAPVGSFKPNAFGIHDMHGNVWEWVEDCYHLDFENAPGDGSAWTTNCDYPDARVMRGGGFLHDPDALRSTVRSNRSFDNEADGLGFRVARAL